MKEIVWGKNTKATNLFKWFAALVYYHQDAGISLYGCVF